MAAPMVVLLRNCSRRIMALPRRQFNVNANQCFLSNTFDKKNDIDMEKLFLRPEVGAILKRITGFDLYRINAPQLNELQEAKVELLTDEQLKEVQIQANKKAEQRLQMPPVMNARPELDEILSKDDAMAGSIDYRMIFTDITFGVPDRHRICVVRETDGLLRSAKWGERERMIQIYFPRPGKKLRPPKMFEEEYLQAVLDDGRYMYVLDRACVQYEPDDPEFIRITHATYNHIQNSHQYHSLRSSRHFGPMAFYYTLNKAIDHLLIYFLNQDELTSAADLVRLYNLVHPNSKSAVTASDHSADDPLLAVQTYCELEAENKGKISLLLNSYKEQSDQQQSS